MNLGKLIVDKVHQNREHRVKVLAIIFDALLEMLLALLWRSHSRSWLAEPKETFH